MSDCLVWISRTTGLGLNLIEKRSGTLQFGQKTLDTSVVQEKLGRQGPLQFTLFLGSLQLSSPRPHPWIPTLGSFSFCLALTFP